MPIDQYLAIVRATLGNAPEPSQIRSGGFTRFSTNGKPGDRAGWLKWFGDRGVYGCKRQGISEYWQAGGGRHLSPADRIRLQRRAAIVRREHDEQLRQRLAVARRANAALWGACRPLVPGDAAWLYLDHRLRGLPFRMPPCLRFHPELQYWHDGRCIGTFPAMVAAFTSPTGELVALHRTYLTPDGRKAALPDGASVKKMTQAAGPLPGGSIRLGVPNADGAIGVAEGLESAMAAYLGSGVPTVAAYSASGLAAWQWPLSTRRVIAFGDRDQAGLKAVAVLEARVKNAGLRVVRAIPSQPGQDWCDVWSARDAAPAKLVGARHD